MREGNANEGSINHGSLSSLFLAFHCPYRSVPSVHMQLRPNLPTQLLIAGLLLQEWKRRSYDPISLLFPSSSSSSSRRLSVVIFLLVSKFSHLLILFARSVVYSSFFCRCNAPWEKRKPANKEFFFLKTKTKTDEQRDEKRCQRLDERRIGGGRELSTQYSRRVEGRKAAGIDQLLRYSGHTVMLGHCELSFLARVFSLSLSVCVRERLRVWWDPRLTADSNRFAPRVSALSLSLSFSESLSVSVLKKPCLPFSASQKWCQKETAAAAVPRRTKPQQQQHWLNNNKKKKK